MHCLTHVSNSLYRLKVIIIPTVFFILVFLVACPGTPFSEDEEEPDTLSLTGTVTDANTGLPIADATVQIYYGKSGDVEHQWNVVKSTKTDQEGLYYMVYQGSVFFTEPSTLGGIPLMRQLRLKATAEGYQWKDSEIQDTELLQTINFQLPPIN